MLRERLGASGDGKERDRTYEFVGEWYLQGYMEGRGIEEQKENGLPTQIFTLVWQLDAEQRPVSGRSKKKKTIRIYHMFQYLIFVKFQGNP